MIQAIQSEAFFRKGQKLASKSHFSQSVRYYDRAIELSKKSSQIFLHKALALSSLNEYEAAINVLKKAIDIDTSNSSYHLFSGIIHYDHQVMEKADRCFNLALALSPNNILALCYKCLACLAKKEDETKSIDILLKKIQNTDTEFKARFLMLCETRLYHNKPKSRSLEQTRFIDTYLNSNGKAAPGWFESISTKFSSALSNLTLLLDRKYKNAYREFLKGEQSLYAGDIDAAQESLQNSLEHALDFPEALDLLSDICIYRNDFDPIFVYLNQIDSFKKINDFLSKKNDGQEVNTDKSDTEILDSSAVFFAGILLTHKGEYNHAIELLKRCVSDQGKDFYPFYYLGLCYLYINDTQKAYNCFMEAMNRLHQELLPLRILEYKRMLMASA